MLCINVCNFGLRIDGTYLTAYCGLHKWHTTFSNPFCGMESFILWIELTQVCFGWPTSPRNTNILAANNQYLVYEYDWWRCRLCFLSTYGMPLIITLFCFSVQRNTYSSISKHGIFQLNKMFTESVAHYRGCKFPSENLSSWLERIIVFHPHIEINDYGLPIMRKPMKKKRISVTICEICIVP